VEEGQSLKILQMMKSKFRFIEKNVDVSGILKQLEQNEDDWGFVSQTSRIEGKKNPYGFMPLCLATVPHPDVSPKETQTHERTPMYYKHTALRKFLKKWKVHRHSRAAFMKLPIGGSVGRHIDDGTYYLTRDRYHLSIQGVYEYTCGNETHIIEPGTFFWFDNKEYHEAQNIGDVERITFVFDVPKCKTNP